MEFYKIHIPNKWGQACWFMDWVLSFNVRMSGKMVYEKAQALIA